MRYDPHNHDRHAIRLKNHDYAEGRYFVSVCTHERECLFGEIIDGEMRSNEIGRIAYKCWEEIPQHFVNVGMDEFQVMPNHLHGILTIQKPAAVGTQHVVSLPRRFQEMVPKSLSSIIRSYKAAVTRLCRNKGLHHFLWQSRFHDHIIRNSEDLERIRLYIRNNSLNWSQDDENPENRKTQ